VTSNSFASVVEQQHNTRGTSDQQQPSEQSGGASGMAIRYVWTLDALLWLMTGILLLMAATEYFFHVWSGFSLLIGVTPTLQVGIVLIVAGSIGLTAFTDAGSRLARLMAPVRIPRRPARTQTPRHATTMRPAYAQDTAQWTVRTEPRTRSAASRRVMEREL